MAGGEYPFKRNDLPFLDGLRGLAALIVVFSHLGLRGWADVGGVSLSGAGKSGVYLFFTLSAYLLARILLNGGEAVWRVGPMTRFYARRVLRIFPLFALFLIVCAVLTFTAGGDPIPYRMNAQAVAAHLALLRGDGVLWSIPVEVKFYVLLPVAAFALHLGVRRSATALVLAAACVTALAEASHLRLAGTEVSVFRYIQVFALGCIFAAVDLRLEGAERSGVVRAFAAILFAASAMGAIALVPDAAEALTDVGGLTPWIHRQYALHAVLWVGVIAGLKYGPSALRRPFEHPLARMTGVISFSLYVWHDLIFAHLDLLAYAAPGEVAWAPPLALAVAVAVLSFRIVERPFLNLTR